MIEVYCDGGRKTGDERSAAAAVAFRDGEEIAYLTAYIPSKTNNEMEYVALRLGIALAQSLGETEAIFLCDSKLIVEQILERWQIKQEHLRPLREEVVRAANSALFGARILWIPREKNKRADELYNQCIELRTSIHHGVVQL